MATRLSTLKEWLISEDQYTREEAQQFVTASEYDENTFAIHDREYKLLTEEEADAAAEEYIKDSLWAFNADFILDHCALENGYTDAHVEALKKMQEALCEDANCLIECMLGANSDTIADFVRDAIQADGRGHFLSQYDGEESSFNDYYIYRTN
jgi:hypothetical protein